MHAAGVWVVHSTRVADRKENKMENKEQTTVKSMQLMVLKEVRKMAYTRMQEQYRCGKWKEFYLAWIETEGMTVDKNKNIYMYILSSGRDAPRIEPHRACASIQTYTDGSFIPATKDEPNPFAGAGISEFHITSGTGVRGGNSNKRHNGPMGRNRAESDTPVDSSSENPRGTKDELTYVESMRVIIDKTDPEYIGASKQSNNTGECTAMYRALCRALNWKTPISGR